MNDLVKINSFDVHIKENAACLKIYQVISKNLDRSLSTFPKYNNLIGVYAIHLLKYITAIYIKNNEIKNRTYIKEFSQLNLKTFPYISYKEIVDKYIDTNKKFGIFSKSEFKKNIKNLIFYYKRFNSPKYFCSVNSITVSDFHFLNKKLNISYFNSNKFFYYEDIGEQLLKIRLLFEEIYDIFNLPFSANEVFNVFKNHILSNSIEGKANDNINGDYIILSSGNDTINRHISAKSKRYFKKIITLDHAYYTGYTDDPNLGLGEQFYSDYFVGYGDFYTQNKHLYQFSANFKNRFISSSSKKITSIKNKVNKCINQIDSFYYFPTSLRGPDYRFGPYMDISDKIYIQWQNKLIKIFKNKIVFKHHPKDKYKNIYRKYHYEVKNNYENINDILDKENICLIFDTIGTAFAEASAFKIPIIFFDTHQRNIPSFVIAKIKKRCLYYDCSSLKEISFDMINNDLQNIHLDFESLDVFSLSNKEKNCDQIEALSKFFSVL